MRRGDRLRRQGKSGREIIVRPPSDHTSKPHENSIVGNTCLYGATGGKLFANGRAGERFAVRNSGATAVVEGVGDHGCEYMTGGTVVVLGGTGKNFGAGMTGGIAYILDLEHKFESLYNPALVVVEPLAAEDEIAVQQLVYAHLENTESAWPTFAPSFRKVRPKPPAQVALHSSWRKWTFDTRRFHPPPFPLASPRGARYWQRMFFRLLLCAFIAFLGLSGCFDNDKKKPGTEKKKNEKKEPAKDLSQDPSFQSFVGRLRIAVGKRDRRELEEAMAPGFGYRWDQAPEGETAFDYWDKNSAWGDLATVLATKFVPHEGYMVAPPQFASEPAYRGYRVGVRQFNGSWKLAYFVTGEDVLQ